VEKKSTTVTLTLEDIKDVKFPMSSYDFKLACQACFKKTGDGIHGSQYVESQHTCTHDMLIVKLRQKNAEVGCLTKLAYDKSGVLKKTNMHHTCPRSAFYVLSTIRPIEVLIYYITTHLFLMI
jgi:hypothetical protein